MTVVMATEISGADDDDVVVVVVVPVVVAVAVVVVVSCFVSFCDFFEVLLG